jgi:pseudouridine-5'-phosphate glycosidase
MSKPGEPAHGGAERSDRIPSVRYSSEVARAVATGQPVVALESTIIAHGLPRPHNFKVAQEFEAIVREQGASPATIAVIDGQSCVGLDLDQLERIALDPTVRKLGMRDLPVAGARRATGATTVSGTAFLAARAGIRVFATGGIGGVHRDWVQTRDESADLGVLARESMTVVCAGVKSILDVPATLQRLETLNVTVIGYGTDEFPGFYLRSSGLPLDWRLDLPEQVATVMAEQDALGVDSSLLVANPVAASDQLDPAVHEKALAEALAAAATAGVEGQALTPYLLDYLVRATDGASLDANLAAVRGNIRLAAQVAVAWAQRTPARRDADMFEMSPSA